MTAGVMHQLNTASIFQEKDDTDNIPNQQDFVTIDYKTGAKFEGKVTNYKRVGSGIFTWPNGCKYEGQYSDNFRQGKGKQTWSDGTIYTGEFLNDLRHGEGKIIWSNGESYEGIFFKDRRHGKGTYRWPDGSVYTGTFYMDQKEGYGTFTFSDGNIFQGLYKEDEREGPGVITYGNGQQDAGLWMAEKMIKFCSPITGAFTIKSHQELEYNEEEKYIFIDLAEKDYPQVPIEHILNPLSPMDYAPVTDLSQRVESLYSETLDYRSLAVNRKAFDSEFFKTFNGVLDIEGKIRAWNGTPRMMQLQKHAHRHSLGQSTVDFDVDAVLKMDRRKFQDKGPIELQSEELITAAMSGDTRKVELLLASGKVHPDVSDCSGHTALIGATVNWHLDVINILLNHGANVNKLNDEGCSAFSAGIIFYYPIEGFIYNIAEKAMKPVQEVQSVKRENQPKSILTNTRERRASKLNQINRIRSQSTVSVPNNLAPASDGEISIKSSSRKISFGNQLSETQNLEQTDVADREDEDGDSAYGEDADDIGEANGEDVDDIGEALAEQNPECNNSFEDFDSNQSIRNYQIEVSEDLIERCATQLSQNELIINRENSNLAEDKARKLAIQINVNERMKETLDLLLRRGADPNASSVPMPALFFAIKSADVDMVRQLLMKGANPNTRLSKEQGGLCPLHIACAIPGDEGVEITELLLNALADPDARAAEDDSFLNKTLEDEWSKDPISFESRQLLGGRTALHIACARDDNYKNASRVIRLLLDHKANTTLICNGYSPLALAIASGNDLAIDELLSYGADPSLPLTHGVGSALCVANNPEFEHRRTIQARLQLVDKLIKAGADLLAPIAIGPKRIIGTAVDYAYYMFSQDRRIAHMPYHALTPAERDTYNARKRLLAHVGDIMRVKAVEREKQRIADEEKVGVRSQSASTNFVYIGAGAKLPPGVKSRSAALVGQGQVKFEASALDGEGTESPTRSGIKAWGNVNAKQLSNSTHSRSKMPMRKPLFKYCYECGRSVGVRLVACTRCKEVYYCSKACKIKAWNARHKEECIRVGGRSRSPSPKHRTDSPTSTTVANKGKQTAASNKILGSSNSSRSRKRELSSISLPSLTSGQFDKYFDSEQDIDRMRDSQNVSEAKSGETFHQTKKANKKVSKNTPKKHILTKQNDNLPQINYNNISLKKSKAFTNQLNKKERQDRLKLPQIQHQTFLRKFVPVKGLSKSAESQRRLAKHKFRTGSPPNYEYVFIDNYSHN
ncbi:ankyrin repeat and MYND domain-containing protein 1 isoform X1 [Biomphalaria glabrata]|nr:ankyrin repeat and MYND domain-containing protein 1 isoform X1 [Biomphalaria glabrata]